MRLTEFSTDWYTTSASTLLRDRLRLWCRRYSPLVVAPIAVCLAVGVMLDLRWVIVALMLLFVVVPMILLPACLMDMTKPSNVEQLGERGEKKVTVSQSKGTVMITWRLTGKEEVFPWADIQSLRASRSLIRLKLKGREELLIPTTAAVEEDDSQAS